MKLYMQKGEKVLYHGAPDRNILVPWFFSSIFYSFMITGFFIATGFSNMIFSLFGDSGTVPGASIIEGAIYGLIIQALVLFSIFLVVTFLYHVALRKTYKYYVTNERVIFEGGILMRRIKSVPFHKVTDVSISQNIVERALGIAKANIQTAGTGMRFPDIQFTGLRNPEKPQGAIVERLRHFQTRRHASAYSE